MADIEDIPTSTEWRALCEELIQLDKEQPTEYSDWKKRWNAAVSRTRAALAQSEPEVSPWPVPGDAEGLAEVFWSRFPTTPCHYPSNPTRDFNLEAPIDT